MDFYIGGCYQGKLDLVKERYKDSIVLDENNIEIFNNISINDYLKIISKNNNIIINHLHLIIKKLLLDGKNQEEIKSIILGSINSFGTNNNLVIISDEIGQGIVPIDDFERSYREVVGRVQIEIAKQSENVWRVLCQMPMKLK